MAKKSSIPAVDLSADDDNIEDEEDVVMTTTAPTQTFVRWTRDEEKLLCEIHDDFNKSTNGVYRTKNMITELLRRPNIRLLISGKICLRTRVEGAQKTPKEGTQRITLTADDQTKISFSDAAVSTTRVKTRPAKKDKTQKQLKQRG
ncbi:hypothetical protein Tco_0850086 [Tanacetum coccineum]